MTRTTDLAKQQEAIRLRRSGLKYQDIADALGLSRNTVRNVLLDHGLGHLRWTPPTVEERFRSKFTVEANGCWIWNGTINRGYGWFGDESGVSQNAHRIAWQLWRGPIPTGMVIDHACHTNDPWCFDGLCLHRRFVNPEHLELVTRSENNRRARDRSLNFQLVDLLA